jgi:hypothetical protein
MERPVLLLMHAPLPSTMCAAQSVTASGRVDFALGHCCTNTSLVKSMAATSSVCTDGRLPQHVAFGPCGGGVWLRDPEDGVEFLKWQAFKQKHYTNMNRSSTNYNLSAAGTRAPATAPVDNTLLRNEF